MKITFPKIETRRLLLVLATFALVAFFACGDGKKDRPANMENMEGMEHDGHDMKQNSKPATDADINMPEMDMSSGGLADSLNIATYVLPVNRQVISAQKTVMVMPADSTSIIWSLGYILPDERRSNKVSARFSGRIEKLYVRYNLQRVKKGEKILDLYSPELNTYQEELLFLIKRNSDSSLVEKAKEKLRLLGLTPEQINRIERNGEMIYSIGIYSPQEGYVLFTTPSPTQGMGSSGINDGSKNASMGGGMGGGSGALSSGAAVVSSNGQIREGDYVNQGQTLFQVNDLQQVWALFAVDNRHQQTLRQGMTVTLNSELYPNETIHATLNLIEPAYQKNQKFILSRVYLKNPGGKYKINSLIKAEIRPANSNFLTVPYSSILFLGKRKIVWVLKGKTPEGNKIFEARDVSIGAVFGNRVVIKSGLNQEEEVALDAGYLLDREGLIQPE
jgi:Cu(I)/Ag(I) efflux system membrane fusion protein